jgi:hypothetical protein
MRQGGLAVLADVLSTEVLRVLPASLEVSRCSSLTGVARCSRWTSDCAWLKGWGKDAIGRAP